jgi:hypothetical protein
MEKQFEECNEPFASNGFLGSNQGIKKRLCKRRIKMYSILHWLQVFSLVIYP